MKWIIAAGLLLSIIGTILTGFVATGGIPKKGDPITAPKKGTSYVGWALILLGFVLQLIGTVLQ